MTFKTLAAAGTAVALALTSAPAFAQAPAPATTAAPAVTHGAAVPGMCVISVEAAIGNSTVGKYVQTRLQQLLAQTNAELNAEKTSIDNDARALEGQRATLDQNTLEQRAAALQVRANALQRKAQQREREIQVTEQKAFGRVGEEMLVAKVDPHRAPEMGTDMALELELDSIHLFDAATEQRLTSQ